MQLVSIDKKIEEQIEFVRWWKEVVTPGKGSSNQYSAKTQIGVLAKDDAEELTGISQQQVSKWNKSLQKPQQYQDKPRLKRDLSALIVKAFTA